MADPILMLWLGKHHYANVPECVDGDLVVVVWEMALQHQAEVQWWNPEHPKGISPQLSPWE